LLTESGNTQNIPLQFTGSGGEYFKIWIVNLALSIITLGIYSAWAKVRKKRYFYGNTLLNGDPFEYLGKPIPILIGRIIALILFAAYSWATRHTFSVVNAIIIVVLAGLVPWIIVRSLAFNARNSAYLNVRFRFSGTYGGAFCSFILPLLLVLGTLGLAYPYWVALRKRFTANNHSFGQTPFQLSVEAKSFFMIYFLGSLIMFALMLLIGIAGGVLAVTMDKAALKAALPVFFVIIPVIYLFLFASILFIQARVTNLVWNNIRLGELAFASSVRTRDLLGLYITNILGIVFTLGLFIPWAVVRMARYRLEHLAVVSASVELQKFVGEAGENIHAAGAEVSDLFDFDIGL
jgi:uncharacterized membrane protein YjgN (DUF898 family)